MDFTVEEMNLLGVYDTSDRTLLLARMRESLADVDDEDMRHLIRATLEKISGMSDAAFAAVPLIPDYDEDGGEMEV